LFAGWLAYAGVSAYICGVLYLLIYLTWGPHHKRHIRCGVAPHSVEHLFNCQSHPMQLTVQDLWNNPAVVADFLNLDNWR